MSKTTTTSVMPMTAKKQLNLRVPEALAVRLHLVARLSGKSTTEWVVAELQRRVDEEFAKNENLGAMEQALSRLAHEFIPASADDLLGLAEVYAKAERCDGLDTRIVEPELAERRRHQKRA